MKHPTFLLAFLLFWSCTPSTPEQAKTGSLSSFHTETEAIKQTIEKLTAECSPEQLSKAQRIADSLYHDFSKDPQQKADPHLQLRCQKLGLFYALNYIYTSDEKDSTQTTKESKYGVTYNIPNDLIREDGSVDYATLRERRHNGQLEPTTN